ncbi:MAG: hypothetical protein A4S09_06790 [Proteobacteria bacterium SG_bin7]|nr:MAG: hypothetical protein A4S09_06790 [Proteobacteria bacterium SG_bin7]
MKVLLTFLFVFSTLSFFAFGSVQNAPPTGPAQIIIDPKSLRERLINENIPILQSMNQVHQAKSQMHIARGNLLPSVSMGMALSIMAGPTFALGTVEFLLPFLLPSRWFDYFQQKDLLEAEKEAYHALQLSTYASAASLYYTHLSDIALKEVALNEYVDLAKTHDLLVKRDTVLGNVSQSDILLARSQAELSLARVARIEQLLIDERSQIRQALSLPIETEMTFAPNSVPASRWEITSIRDAVTEAMKVAPESKQLEYLLKAADNGKWSKVFAFISGASVGSSSFGGGNAGNGGGLNRSVSFDNLTMRQNVNFGFAYFPAIELAQKNVEAIRLRQRELLIDNTQVLEKVILSIKQAVNRYELAKKAEADFQKVYETAVKRYDLGMESLLNVLIKRRQVTEAATEKVAAESSLNLFRVTLNRALILDEFNVIPGCHINTKEVENARGSAWDWITNIFTGKRNGVELDKACRGHT